MKHIFIFVLVTLLSCSAEKRITEHSYTDLCFFEKKDGTYSRYQVYQTKCKSSKLIRCRKYILVYKKNQKRTVRRYINDKQAVKILTPLSL